MALNLNEYMFIKKIYLFPWMDIISLNEYISLNEDIFPWTNWYGFISCQNIIASNDYTFCE